MPKDIVPKAPKDRVAGRITLRACDPLRDGEFIRSESRENFFTVIDSSIGWDEQRHCKEPEFPEQYRIVMVGEARIGFFRLVESTTTTPAGSTARLLSISTIQLIAGARNQGIGTQLLVGIEAHARSTNVRALRLRVFHGNPAKKLYRRLGFHEVESDEHSSTLEKPLFDRSSQR